MVAPTDLLEEFRLNCFQVASLTARVVNSRREVRPPVEIDWRLSLMGRTGQHGGDEGPGAGSTARKVVQGPE